MAVMMIDEEGTLRYEDGSLCYRLPKRPLDTFKVMLMLGGNRRSVWHERMGDWLAVRVAWHRTWELYPPERAK